MAALYSDHRGAERPIRPADPPCLRSEEHTSELQSQSNLVCRLLLEKKKKIKSHEKNIHLNESHTQITHALRGWNIHTDQVFWPVGRAHAVIAILVACHSTT